MNRKIISNLALPAVLLGLAAPAAWAHSDGAPERTSGAPGETTCVSCHGGRANSGAGKLQVNIGGSSSYTPGQKVRVSVTLDDPAARRWGFELSAKTETGAGSAGSLQT